MTVGPALPALRQLVFLAADLGATLAAAGAELGLKPGVRDPAGMAELGFVHEVRTIENTFLEFTAPLAPDTMPGRLVARRGDGGYMLVVQVADIDATVERAAALGLAPVFTAPYEGHSITQWHPRDFGTLAEFDQIRPADSWHMAPRIFATGSTDVVGDVTAVQVAVTDPVTVAATWAAVLGLAAPPGGTTLDLSGRTVTFVPADPDGRRGLVTVDLPATDRGRAGQVRRISGVDFRLR
jgi:hypothetical protein